jgi:dipeptidyl aminopeptidase/acylaminoacyl peptidase
MRTKFSSKAIVFLIMLSVGALLLPAFAKAQKKHTPSVEELMNLKYLGSPSISPDGRFVAYEVQETNWRDNQFARQIWLVNVSTGETFQLTHGKNSAGGASWSPDGKWLAFATERDSGAVEPPSITNTASKPGGRQVWLISPGGGEAWQLTKSGTSVGLFHWSKDSRYVAFTASAPETKPSADRRDKYGDYQVFEKDYVQSQLWSVDVTEAQKDRLPQPAKQLTADPAINVTDFAWSPDSVHIAFTATPSPLMAFFGDQDIYLLDLSKKQSVTKIVALPSLDTLPIFSPDGKYLAFLTWLGQPDFFYANCHIATVEIAKVLEKAATTPTDVRDLSAKFDENPLPLEWGADGIYFTAEQKTNTHLFRLNPQTGEIQRVSLPDTLLIEGASFTRDLRTVAIVTEDASHMTELYVSSVASFAPRKLTDMTAQVKDWALGTSEVISWKSQDGTEIEGVLRKPADYDPKRKYPLFVEIHGGPSDTSRPTLSPAGYAYPIQLFLAKGALVLQPNYRGSAGYGAAFRALNVRNLGTAEMSDVLSGVDRLIKEGVVDPNRMGAMGSSWGGYISSFILTHTDCFKAISESSGITDTLTDYVNTDVTPFFPQYLRAKPWDDPGIYAKTSPVTTVKQAKTPTLIQHGINDRRVPVPNAYELYRGLQDQGVESRMMLYTGFGHGVNEPKSMLGVMQSNLDWFSHYIWNEPIPKDSPLFGISELGVGK